MRTLLLDEVKIDLISVNSLNWNPSRTRCTELDEVRIRAVARTKDKTAAARIGEEVEAMCINGPAGGCGAVKRVTEIMPVPTLITQNFS